MKRWHLVELEDLPWMPRVLRDGATDVLDWMFGKLGMYRQAVGPMRDALEASRQREIVDLCSGGGGGAMAMMGYLGGEADVRMVLTDRYPNATAVARIADERVRYHAEPVDAFAVPRELRGVRTMYSALQRSSK